MATDYLSAYDLEPVQLQPETLKKIDEHSPPIWSHGNPIDLTGAATLEGFRNVVSICAAAEEIDSSLVIYAPNGLFSSYEFACHTAEVLSKDGSPIERESFVKYSNSGNTMNIKVECYAGYRGEETPRRMWMGDRKIDVKEVRDRWLAPNHRYFKILGDDNAIYIIRHDSSSWVWELVFFKAEP